MTTTKDLEHSCEVAVIIIRNSKNEFLVHRRSALRKLYPSLCGLGAGGKLDKGEAPLEAAIRELREETGIEETPIYRFSFNFSDSSVSTRLHVFEIKSDEVVQWDRREWDSWEWRTEAQVRELSIAGQLCPDTKVLFDNLTSS